MTTEKKRSKKIAAKTARTDSEKQTSKESSQKSSAKNKPKSARKGKSDTPNPKMSRDNFLEASGIREDELAKVTMKWKELAAIYEEYDSEQSKLSETKDMIVRAISRCDAVHSVSGRVKSPAHFVRKIVRKLGGNTSRKITYSNYKSLITDRVGIRALHLYKHDWLDVHKFIMGQWKQREKPTAYYREGDDVQILAIFENEGCNVEANSRSYRSVHYLIETMPYNEVIPVEIQVRTLFEEAWCEIDHRINYPKRASSAPVRTCLQLFNRIAGSADEMGTFLASLYRHEQNQDARVATQERRVAELEEKLSVAINDAEMSEKEKSSLREMVKELKKQTSEIIQINPYTSSAHQPFSLTLANDNTLVISEPTLNFGTQSLVVDLGGRFCEKCGKSIPASSAITLGADLCGDCHRNF